MPAPSWSSLQRYEAQFDTALATILAPFAAAPYSFTLYPQRSVVTLVTPRLEYQFTKGRSAGPRGEAQLRSGDVAPRAIAFEFSLLFRFVFDRVKLTADQAVFDGALRDLLAPPPPSNLELGAFNSTTLPWLTVGALDEVRAIRGVVKGEQADLQLDAWESTWEGIFSIREDAMPA